MAGDGWLVGGRGGASVGWMQVVCTGAHLAGCLSGQGVRVHKGV